MPPVQPLGVKRCGKDFWQTVKTTFLRGTEWAATGKVTLTETPANFPTADAISKAPYQTPAK